MRSKLGLKTKNYLSKSTLKEPITFWIMASSIIVEVALLELKVLTYQIRNGGCKPIVKHIRFGKNSHTFLLNIIYILCTSKTYKIQYYKVPLYIINILI